MIPDWSNVPKRVFWSALGLVRLECGEEPSSGMRRVLAPYGVDVDDHATWPLHREGCDGVGAVPCWARIDELLGLDPAVRVPYAEESRRLVRLANYQVGEFVVARRGTRVGEVVKVNQVTVGVRLIGGQRDRWQVITKNLDPRFISRPLELLRPVPGVGEEVLVRDYRRYPRHGQVVAVDGPFVEAVYAVQSGESRRAWFDLGMLFGPG